MGRRALIRLQALIELLAAVVQRSCPTAVTGRKIGQHRQGRPIKCFGRAISVSGLLVVCGGGGILLSCAGLSAQLAGLILVGESADDAASLCARRLIQPQAQIIPPSFIFPILQNEWILLLIGRPLPQAIQIVAVSLTPLFVEIQRFLKPANTPGHVSLDIM